MAEHEQPLSGDTIAHDLRTLARQASRLPDSHKAKVHEQIDSLLDSWQLAQLEVPC